MTAIVGPEYNHSTPPHYVVWDGMIDTFAIHKSILTVDEYRGFLKGNILKYKLRMGDKPSTPMERDLSKVNIYREELIKFNKEQVRL
tara:strand:+ start:2307 stop:2567 length:261 start_codon:yes stop_codon:yes gene_type:complete